MLYTIKMIDLKTGKTEETFLNITFTLESAVESIQEFVKIDMQTWGKRRYKYILEEADEEKLITL